MEENKKEESCWILIKGGVSSVIIFMCIIGFNVFMFWVVMQLFNGGDL